MRSRSRHLALGLLPLIIWATACGDDGSDAGEGATLSTIASDADDAAAGEPAGESAGESAGGSASAAGRWEREVPGGDCQCADGSEFSFWVREADPEKVVLFFQGGGACFSAETCRVGGGTSKLTTGPADDPTGKDGVWDFDNPANPFSEHSFVFVPYCTGDVHLGTKTQAYSPEVTIQHKGFVNGSAALDHLVDTFPDATELVVTGESAGSIPSPLYGGLAADRLPDAEVTVLADGSGAYADVPGINAAIGALWGTEGSIPDWPEAEGLAVEDWSIPGLFVQAGRHDPDIVFARHDYAFDAVQREFVTLTGLPGADNLQGVIDDNERQIESSGIDLLSYIAPGEGHTILSQDGFYREEVEGVPLVDWVTDLVEGRPPDDVHCQSCTAPPAA
jgi:Pectinacetylesterase